MQLSELIHKESMDLNLDTKDKTETLRYLTERFYEAGGVTDVDQFVESLEAREEQSTTGVGDEIAIPHAQHESVKEAAIVFGRKKEGIDWDSFDGQPAKLIFMIAAPTGGANEHLDALAKLSSVLMDPDAKAALLDAETPEQVLLLFQSFEDDEEETEISSEEGSQGSVSESEEDVNILGVTACPTGIAHTFMAQEKLQQAGKNLGYNIKVEANGQSGVDNRLTKQDIENATAIIVAADRQVEMARFHGKPVITVPVADGINRADELVEQAANKEARIYQAGDDRKSEDYEEGDESLGRRFYKHLMNGVSHMLPFVVAGGILIALSFFWGINAADPTHETYSPIAQFLNVTGNMAFAMMLPMLAGFIGKSMGDRPGLVVGFMGGIFSNPETLSAFGLEGVFANAEASGFLGALVAGFLAGGIIWLLRKAFSWLPKSLEGMKPIFIYPVLGVLLMALLMFFVVNAPMAYIMNGLVDLINSIPQEYTLILGFLVAAMMSIDMGGPINKAAYVTGTALVTASGAEGSNVMAAVMIGGMVPPLSIAIAATVNKNLWNEEERNSALVNYVMGAAFITEGAIPFAAQNPLKVIPSLAFGSGVAGALSMLFGATSQVPHGGVFAVLAGGVSNPLLYILAWVVGGIVGAVLLMIFLREKQTVKTT